jgi:hypothetical protein
MPGLKICGRALQIGSDDFVVPGFCGLALRVAWYRGMSCTTHFRLSLMIAVIVLNFEVFYDCGILIPVYLAGSIVIFAVAALIEVVIAVSSMRGTVMTTKPRLGFFFPRLVLLSSVIRFSLHAWCFPAFGVMFQRAR